MSKRIPSKELRQMWVQHVAHHKALGTKVLRMMRHPEATQQQLWELHQQYTETMKNFYNLRKILRELYPTDRNIFYTAPPWHSEEVI